VKVSLGVTHWAERVATPVAGKKAKPLTEGTPLKLSWLFLFEDKILFGIATLIQSSPAVNRRRDARLSSLIRSKLLSPLKNHRSEGSE